MAMVTAASIIAFPMPSVVERSQSTDKSSGESCIVRRKNGTASRQKLRYLLHHFFYILHHDSGTIFSFGLVY
jgi:hypothetical protein